MEKQASKTGMIVKVGDILSSFRNSKGRINNIFVSYNDVEFDENGWADAEKFLPEDYDLVSIRVEGKKDTYGWVVGEYWDGVLLRSRDKVIAWKRELEKND